jgi:ppGpp synthetase/RelA/SpoT-type nucleotidyltranferase
MKELKDLVGLRLMRVFKRDVARVCDLVSETFTVVSQEDTAQRLGEAEIGYQSLHYVIKLPEKWLSVPSFKGLDDLQAELQVRTVAQHIWAAASHILQYKQEASVPPAGPPVNLPRLSPVRDCGP